MFITLFVSAIPFLWWRTFCPPPLPVNHHWKIENEVFNTQKKEGYHLGHQLKNIKEEIFSDHGVPLAKRQILESIDTLSDEQVHAVSAFIRYLTEYQNE